MELADRLSDLQERAAQPHGLSDDEAKELFLSALYEGKTNGEAGRYAGRTSTWFRRRCNPDAANYDEVWVIGGASIYEQFLTMHENNEIVIDEMCITRMEGTYECDTFFPFFPSMINSNARLK